MTFHGMDATLLSPDAYQGVQGFEGGFVCTFEVFVIVWLFGCLLMVAKDMVLWIVLRTMLDKFSTTEYMYS